MTRLELIMSERKPLSVDDARELLSEHIEGVLDDAVRAEVDALLAQHAELRQQRDAIERTMQALHALPRPQAPDDMVAKVRARLVSDRRAEQASSAPVVAARARFRWGGLEAAIGLAAAASIAVFVMVVGLPGSHKADDDTMTAGFGERAGVVEATLVAPGFPRETLVELAVKAGMDTVTAEAFEGEGRAAARFVLMLKAEGVARGVEVSGVVPEAGRVRLVIKTSP